MYLKMFPKYNILLKYQCINARIDIYIIAMIPISHAIPRHKLLTAVQNYKFVVLSYVWFRVVV